MKTPEEWCRVKWYDHIEIIREIQTEAYNQAIRDAAQKVVKDELGIPFDPHSVYHIVTEQSILKLLKR